MIAHITNNIHMHPSEMLVVAIIATAIYLIANYKKGTK